MIILQLLPVEETNQTRHCFTSELAGWGLGLVLSGILFTALPTQANNYGSLGSENISDSATICMNVGIVADLTGLDDLVLVTDDPSGSAGALYYAEDTFHLESNGSVRILMEDGLLSQGNFTVRPTYTIDGKSGIFETPLDEQHNADHTIRAEVRIGNISSQLAGDYSGTISLTVVPQASGATSCGAIAISFPSSEYENWAVLAFEDLYPNPGDADYNDMVLRFNATESYTADGELESVNLSYLPIATGAGYNHSFWVSLDGTISKVGNLSTDTSPIIDGGGKVRVSYVNLDNGLVREKYFDFEDDIPVFLNTRQTLEGFANVYDNGDITYPREFTSIEIIPDNPELNLFNDRGDILSSDYRSFLYVNNTRYGIDLYDVNSADGMVDENGYPFGLIVPADWAWPMEGVNINDAYPHFAEYRAWLMGETSELSYEAEHWYNAPSTQDGLVFDTSTLPDYSDLIESTDGG